MKNQVGFFRKKTEMSKMSKMNCDDCDSTIFGYCSVIYRHNEGVFKMSENQNGGLAMAWREHICNSVGIEVSGRSKMADL